MLISPTKRGMLLSNLVSDQFNCDNTRYAIKKQVIILEFKDGLSYTHSQNHCFFVYRDEYVKHFFNARPALPSHPD